MGSTVAILAHGCNSAPPSGFWAAACNGTQMSGLTTHVLDTMHGQPASGLSLRLRRGGEVLVEAVTNLDGRVDKPLLVSPYGYSTDRGS